MQVKVYKIMFTTPSGGHWFLHIKPYASNWEKYSLYSKEEADKADSYASAAVAELFIGEFRKQHPNWVYASRPGRGMRVKYERLTAHVVEFIAEVL